MSVMNWRAWPKDGVEVVDAIETLCLDLNMVG